MTAAERLLRYVQFDTQSNEFSDTCPSTDKQKVLALSLVEEMKAMGISDSYMDAEGYVYGTVPGDPTKPVIGLIAHMDTAPDASGANIQARIVPYEGGDIVLNEDEHIVMQGNGLPQPRPEPGQAPHRHRRHHAPGRRRQGRDCGNPHRRRTPPGHPRSPHATLRIGFTPDEEIGRGADRFDLKDFGAEFAYTADGGTLGELEYENFNAAAAKVDVPRPEHPSRFRQEPDGERPAHRHGVPQSAPRRTSGPKLQRATRASPCLTDMKGTVELSQAALHHPGPRHGQVHPDEGAVWGSRRLPQREVRGRHRGA